MVILCLQNLIAKTNWILYIPWDLFILLFIFIVFNQNIAPCWLEIKKKQRQNKPWSFTTNSASRASVRPESVIDEVGITMTRRIADDHWVLAMCSSLCLVSLSLWMCVSLYMCVYTYTHIYVYIHTTYMYMHINHVFSATHIYKCTYIQHICICI